MFLGWSSTKFLFFVPVGYSTWLPGPIICSDWLKFQREIIITLKKSSHLSECEIVNLFTGHSVWWTKVIHQTESSFTRPKENHNFFNISLLMADLYSFLYLYKALFIVIDFNYGSSLMSYETNKEKNGMGTKIFITIYIPNSFIVNILSPREGKRLSNYLLHQ